MVDLTTYRAMPTVSLSTKGQIVIPKAFRTLHGLGAGDRLAATIVGDELRLHVLPPATAVTPSSLQPGLLRRPARTRLSDEATRQRITQHLAAQDNARKS